jgi:hypothetical protein
VFYYGQRFYSPALERWISRDPIGEIGGANWYAFLSNRAGNSVDAYGLFEVPGWVPTWYELFSNTGIFGLPGLPSVLALLLTSLDSDPWGSSFFTIT